MRQRVQEDGRVEIKVTDQCAAIFTHAGDKTHRTIFLVALMRVCIGTHKTLSKITGKEHRDDKDEKFGN